MSMIPSGMSCSTMLHLLARHPVVVATLGLASTLALVLYTSVSPGLYSGAEEILNHVEAQLIQETNLDMAAIDKAVESIRATQELCGGIPRADIETYRIEYVLQNFRCNGISVQDVLANLQLRERVERLYFLDLVRRYGLEAAKVLLCSPP